MKEILQQFRDKLIEKNGIAILTKVRGTLNSIAAISHQQTNNEFISAICLAINEEDDISNSKILEAKEYDHGYVIELKMLLDEDGVKEKFYYELKFATLY